MYDEVPSCSIPSRGTQALTKIAATVTEEQLEDSVDRNLQVSHADLGIQFQDVGPSPVESLWLNGQDSLCLHYSTASCLVCRATRRLSFDKPKLYDPEEPDAEAKGL